jgi:hypothetical protein
MLNAQQKTLEAKRRLELLQQDYTRRSGVEFDEDGDEVGSDGELVDAIGDLISESAQDHIKEKIAKRVVESNPYFMKERAIYEGAKILLKPSRTGIDDLHYIETQKQYNKSLENYNNMKLEHQKNQSDKKSMDYLRNGKEDIKIYAPKDVLKKDEEVWMLAPR